MHEKEDKYFKVKKRSSVDVVGADDSFQVKIQQEGPKYNIR